MELEVLRHERREADDAEEHEDGGEAVEDVDLVPEESFAAVHGVLEELLGRVDLLLVHLVHPLLVGVLAAGQGLQGQNSHSGFRKMEEETKERLPNCVTSVRNLRKEKQTTTEFYHCTIAAAFTTALI